MRLLLGRRWLVAVVVTAGLALSVVAVVLVAGVPRRRSTAPPAQPSRAAPSGSSTPQTGTLIARVPVYYVGAGRLFREYHDLKVSPDTVPGRVAAAVTEMVRGGSPFDPDYATLWPDGIAVRDVHIDGGVATVDLSGVGLGPRLPSPSPSLSLSPTASPSPSPSVVPVSGPVAGRLAVQQLVWTVAAAVADTPVGHVDGVVLHVDGASVGSLWSLVDAGGVLRADPPADVLAPVWLIEPQEGATVGKTFTVHVAGAVLPGALHLRVRSSAGALVKDEVVPLDRAAPDRGEATIQLTLAPGRYTVEAVAMPAAALDDHTITVK